MLQERERFLSERVGQLAWKIPGLDIFKKCDLRDRITAKERQRLGVLHDSVLQRVQALVSDQKCPVVPGLRGPMTGCIQELCGQAGRKYRCVVVSDGQRLEVTINDSPVSPELPIRKFRVFVGKFLINGEETTSDLSALEDKTYSWRRNSSDSEYPEKGLTLKESCRYMEEILHALPAPFQPKQSFTELGSGNKQT